MKEYEVNENLNEKSVEILKEYAKTYIISAMFGTIRNEETDRAFNAGWLAALEAIGMNEVAADLLDTIMANGSGE